MRKRWRESVLLMQIAVAVSYALAYLVVRPFSDAHWALTSGLRVASLLLVPYRFWPALIAGEIFPLAWWNYKAGLDYGLIWVTVASVPPIALGMPIAWWCRKKLALFPSRRQINMGALLQCLLWLSTVWALASHLLYLTGRPLQSEDWVSPAVGLVLYFLGNYLGMITILPWILLARLGWGKGVFQFELRQILENKLARDICFVVLPLMMAMFALSHVDTEEIGKITRATMILPVAWLTLRHGWRASVLGGTFLATCICVMFDCKADVEMVQAQAYVAIEIACLYALGACISAQTQQKDQASSRMLQTQRAAKNSLSLGERRLEQASKALESVLGVLEVQQLTVSEKLRHLSTDAERWIYDRQASMLQQRVFHLAESIHPSAWRQSGMEAALRDSVGRVLHEAKLSYQFCAKRRLSEALSPSMQATVYRGVCAAVASMSLNLTCASIDVIVREGVTRGHHWVMFRVDGNLSESAIARNVCFVEERERVAPRLGASTLEFEELRNLIRLFDGELRVRESNNAIRVTALLFDNRRSAREDAVVFAAPRLWVS